MYGLIDMSYRFIGHYVIQFVVRQDRLIGECSHSHQQDLSGEEHEGGP